MNTLLLFFMLSAVNCLMLLCVAWLLRATTKNREKLMKNFVRDELTKEENKLSSVLDEIANLSALVYGDIIKRQKELEQSMVRAEELMTIMKQQETDMVCARVEEPVALPLSRMAVLSEPEAEGDVEHQAIYLLADEGHSVLEIAQNVGRQRGEIELILNLRKIEKRLHDATTP